MQRLGWKEKYVSILMFAIGLMYLCLQIFSLISSKSASVAFENEKVILNRNQFLSDLRSYITVVLCFSGAFLLWRIKSFGWIIGVAVLGLFILIAGSGLFLLIRMAVFDISFVLVVSAVLFLFFAMACLLIKSTRNKYGINPAVNIVTMIVFLLLAAFYFFLQ